MNNRRDTSNIRREEMRADVGGTGQYVPADDRNFRTKQRRNKGVRETVRLYNKYV